MGKGDDKELDNWRLKSITIELEEPYGKEPYYKGNVYFINDRYDTFRFRLTPDMAHSYMRLIAEEVVVNVKKLSERTLQSFIDQGFISREDIENFF